jgi:hypothetical protein
MRIFELESTFAEPSEVKTNFVIADLQNEEDSTLNWFSLIVLKFGARRIVASWSLYL